MKWLFIMLAIVNLIIFGWGFQQERSRPEAIVVEYPVVGNLRLLSEIDKTPTVAAKSPQLEEIPSEVSLEINAPIDAAKEILPGDGREDAVEVMAEAPVAVLTEIPTETEVEIEEEPPASIAIATLEQKLAQASPSTPTEEVEVVTPHIDEAKGAERGEVAEVVAVGASTTELVIEPSLATPEEVTFPPKEAALVCGAYGPFEKGADARSLADQVYRLGMDSSLRQGSYTETIGYWVMIPPLESQEEAIETVQELKALGIKDIRRFFRGEHRNGISLGAYSRQRNADNRRQALISKGYKVIIKPRQSERQAYWLDYRDGKGESAGLFQQLREQYPEIDHQIYPCSRIVTSSGIN
ncbi:MAG: hypothetical protein ABW185_24105 [Sedimenticola sp.]